MPKPRIVLKFGGAALAGAAEIKNMIGVVRGYAKTYEVVVVVSALAGVTDKLRDFEAQTSRGQWSPLLQSEVEAVQKRHLDLCSEPRLTRLLSSLSAQLQFQAERGLAKQLSDDFWHAQILSYGELCASVIVAHALYQAHDRVRLFDNEMILTDSNARRAMVLPETAWRIIRQMEKVKSGFIAVVPGFIAVDEDAQTTLLDRGGSDYTATLIGAALGCDVVLLKEVDGIYTADPRLVSEARQYDYLSYSDADALASSGVKVLHPLAVVPAAKRKIRITVRNAFHPEHPPTVIMEHMPRAGVLGIACTKGLAIVSVAGPGMMGFTGFAEKIFSVANKLKVNIVMMSQSPRERSIALVVRKADGKHLELMLADALDQEFKGNVVEEVTLIDDCAAVSVISSQSDRVDAASGVAAITFKAMRDAGIKLHIVSQPSGEGTLSLVVPEKAAQRAAQALHYAFNLHGGDR